jgi:hypothetical protein
MNFDEIISSVAFSLSFIEIYKQIETADFVNVETKSVVVLSLISSCLWFIYQYRKFQANVTTIFTGVGIAVQVYILNKIISKEKKMVKDSE